jgi:hypothetical protein
MKIILLITFMLLSGSLWADVDNRYLQSGKVLYENPLEEDVLRVNLALGYCTVLEFPEKPLLVTVGDNSLIQVEVPQNSKSVVIKPLQNAGETNIFIFTPNQRFNYNVIIGDPLHVDYVVDSQAVKQINLKGKEHLSLEKFLKMAREYEFLKHHNVINEREFMQKSISSQCSYPKFNIDLIEAFSNKDPNYLVLHIRVNNLTDEVFNLIEQSANIQINGQKFIPQYVLFDSDQLFPNNKTDGWLVLENSFVSIDNKFSLTLGVDDEEYTCE